MHAHYTPELVSFPVVVQRVEGHLEDFVSLTKSVPRPVIPLIYLDCMSYTHKHMEHYNTYDIEQHTIIHQCRIHTITILISATDHTDQFAYIHQELMDEVEGCQYFVQGHNQQLCACELTCVVVE